MFEKDEEKFQKMLAQLDAGIKTNAAKQQETLNFQERFKTEGTAVRRKPEDRDNSAIRASDVKESSIRPNEILSKRAAEKRAALTP